MEWCVGTQGASRQNRHGLVESSPEENMWTNIFVPSRKDEGIRRKRLLGERS
jgi:hypothetical protein